MQHMHAGAWLLSLSYRRTVLIDSEGGSRASIPKVQHRVESSMLRSIILTVVFGALCLIQSKAMSCHYWYNIQPGPTSKICPLEGNSQTALVLQCQVSSDRGANFSIIWHHNKSEPNSTNIIAPITNSTDMVINMSGNTRTDLTSQLTLHGFDDKGSGFYWCSVDSSNDDQIATHNPSVVLRIKYQEHCNQKYDNCQGDIYLYSVSSSSRCADQAVSINVLNAQNCSSIITQMEEKPPHTPLAANPTTFNPDSAIQTSSQQSVLPMTTQPTPQQTTSAAPTFQLSMGVTIGASIGGLILILIIMIVPLLLCMCVVWMKHKRRARERRDEPVSPFDDIRMYSSIAKLTQEKVVDDDANRVSKMYCESNICYECPHTQPTENIYEYIT